MNTFKKFFGFKGRATRDYYWGVLAIGIVVNALARWLVEDDVGGLFYLFFVFFIYLPFIWIAICTLIKRCHDVNKSGWWVLFSLIPIVGTIWGFLTFPFEDGTVGPNKYGEDPKHRVVNIPNIPNVTAEIPTGAPNLSG